jgi:ketosteroid isomerase-like protein
MTSRNAAVVHTWTDAFNRRDFDSVLEDLDPEVELQEWPAAPDPRTYRGPEGIRKALDSWFEAWEWMQVEIENIEEAGDRILVTAHQRAKGRGSAVEVEIDTSNVYTFRDGKVIRIQLFTDRDPALEAAGLTKNQQEERR